MKDKPHQCTGPECPFCDNWLEKATHLCEGGSDEQRDPNVVLLRKALAALKDREAHAERLAATLKNLSHESKEIYERYALPKNFFWLALIESAEAADAVLAAIPPKSGNLWSAMQKVCETAEHHAVGHDQIGELGAVVTAWKKARDG